MGAGLHIRGEVGVIKRCVGALLAELSPCVLLLIRSWGSDEGESEC